MNIERKEETILKPAGKNKGRRTGEQKKAGMAVLSRREDMRPQKASVKILVAGEREGEERTNEWKGETRTAMKHVVEATQAFYDEVLKGEKGER